MQHRFLKAALIATSLFAASFVADAHGQVQIRVTNLSPTNGTPFTPVWLGIHDGSYHPFTAGVAASAAFERLAEDGNTAPLMTAFGAAGFSTQTTLLGPSTVFMPGQSATASFMLNGANPMTRYLSYASMILPSNDAFIGNQNGIDLTDGFGNLRSFSFFVMGNQVWDAGTEVNDELEATTAFFSQSVENTGTNENGVVRLHSGFIPGGRILSAPQFANADFRANGYQVARFDVTVTPEPATWMLMGVGLLVIAVGSRRRHRITAA